MTTDDIPTPRASVSARRSATRAGSLESVSIAPASRSTSRNNAVWVRVDVAGYSRTPSGGLLEASLDVQPGLDRVMLNERQPGDLLLMRFSSDPQHLAICAGDTIIHAYEVGWAVLRAPIIRFVGISDRARLSISGRFGMSGGHRYWRPGRSSRRFLDRRADRRHLWRAARPVGGGLLAPPKGPTVTGPRLDDLTVQTSTYGAVIPRVYGTVAVNGNVFWLENNRLKETMTKKKSGGKGGGGKRRPAPIPTRRPSPLDCAKARSKPFVAFGSVQTSSTMQTLRTRER